MVHATVTALPRGADPQPKDLVDGSQLEMTILLAHQHWQGRYFMVAWKGEQPGEISGCCVYSHAQIGNKNF
jgi:hypothetical protein